MFAIQSVSSMYSGSIFDDIPSLWMHKCNMIERDFYSIDFGNHLEIGYLLIFLISMGDALDKYSLYKYIHILKINANIWSFTATEFESCFRIEIQQTKNNNFCKHHKTCPYIAQPLHKRMIGNTLALFAYCVNYFASHRIVLSAGFFFSSSPHSIITY